MENGVTFDEDLELLMTDGVVAEGDFERELQREEELVVFVQPSARVAESLVGQVLDDIGDPLCRVWRFLRPEMCSGCEVTIKRFVCLVVGLHSVLSQRTSTMTGMCSTQSPEGRIHTSNQGKFEQEKAQSDENKLTSSWTCQKLGGTGQAMSGTCS